MEVEVIVGMSAKKVVETFKPLVEKAEEIAASDESGDGGLQVELYGEPNGPNDPQITKLTFSNDDMERDEIRERVVFDWSEL